MAREVRQGNAKNSNPTDSVRLSVVIVNYNGMAYLEACVQSIERHVSEQHEIIIVDNASEDDSVAYICKNFPHVHLIPSETNLGFAGGNNLGVSFSRGEYILLLNCDTIICSDLKRGISILEQKEDIGIVGAKMLNAERHYRRSAMSFPNFPKCLKVSTLNIKRGPFNKGHFGDRLSEKFYQVDAVEGSFMLMRKSLWELVRGMDESFFMYGEDVDFCKRAKLAGYQTAYYPALQYIHFGGFSPPREYLVVKGILLYHKRYSPVALYTVVYVTMFGRSALRCLFYLALAYIENKQDHFLKSKAALYSLKHSFF